MSTTTIVILSMLGTLFVFGIALIIYVLGFRSGYEQGIEWTKNEFTKMLLKIFKDHNVKPGEKTEQTQ